VYSIKHESLWLQGTWKVECYNLCITSDSRGSETVHDEASKHPNDLNLEGRFDGMKAVYIDKDLINANPNISSSERSKE
jgi:hypothetical protein